VTEFELLKQYLHEYIDRMKPVTLGYQIELYRRHGYIDEGYNGTFISFERWKEIRQWKSKLQNSEV